MKKKNLAVDINEFYEKNERKLKDLDTDDIVDRWIDDYYESMFEE